MALYRTHKMHPPIDMTQERSDLDRKRLFDRLEALVERLERQSLPDIYEDDLMDIQDRVLYPKGLMQ